MKSSPDNLSEFECIICQLIYTNPIKLKTCSHCFCKECISNAITMQKNEDPYKFIYQCLICRQDFMKKDIIAYSSLAKELLITDYQCECNQIIKLSEYNQHIDKCPLHLKTIETSIQQTKVKDVKSHVNRATFICPICNEKNFERIGFIDHVKQRHHNSQGVCPICLSQPWGDPNYVTQLYGHLIKRHMFDYDEVVDYNNEEDDVLARVLKESLNYQ